MKTPNEITRVVQIVIEPNTMHIERMELGEYLADWQPTDEGMHSIEIDIPRYCTMESRVNITNNDPKRSIMVMLEFRIR